MKKLLFLLVVLLVVYLIYSFTANTPRKMQETISNVNESDISVIAQNLDVPWDVAFLPNKDILFTERQGDLIRIGQGRKVYSISGVTEVGEGGLMGLAIDPDFENNHFIYLFLTTNGSTGLENRIERHKLENDNLSERRILLDGIKGSSNHDGGRLRFGPDGLLYATTGDAEEPDLAQNTNSLNGKILRITRDGEFPKDNPFGNAVYSYGHRNSQGIAWDNQKRLWATEHGRSGLASGYDELNLVEKGKNYGWPEIEGDETRQGMVSPVINSGPNETWAPAGAVFYKNSIFFAGLRGETLYRYNIVSKQLTKHFEGEYGRLRAVSIDLDNFLFLSTSNNDGRGDSMPNDDKIIKINPESLD